MSFPSDNKVDRVLVSEGTRAMATGRAGKSSVGDEVETVDAELEANYGRKRQIENAARCPERSA